MRCKLWGLCFYLVSICCYAESPKHINIGFASAETKEGKQYYCISILEGASKPTCYRLTGIPAKDVTVSVQSTYPRFRKVTLSNFGLLRQGADLAFSATINWTGVAAGVLQFNGPEGTVIASGKIAREDASAGRGWRVDIETFGDASLSEEFDRSFVFGETDSTKLDVVTAAWIQDVLVPNIQQYLSQLERAPISHGEALP